MKAQMSRLKSGWVCVLLAGLLSAAVFLSGCSVSDPVTYELPEASVAEEGEALTRETVLELAMPAEVNTWHPLRAAQREIRSILGLIYEPLIETDSDGSPCAGLAASWSVDADSRIWTFTLRKNAVWHDGEPLTAEDVIYTLDLLKTIDEDEELYSIYAEHLSYWVSWEALDDETVRMVSKKPFYGALASLDFPILPAHLGLSADDVPSKLVGTGPYRVESRSKSEVILVRSETWWKRSASADQIRVTAYEDETSAFSALQLRQIRVLQTDSMPVTAEEGLENVQEFSYVTPYLDVLLFNGESGDTASAAVRRACALALDRRTIVSDIFNGAAIRTDTPIIPGSWMDTGSSLVFNCDTDAAEDCLEEAGWSKSDDEGTWYDIAPDGEKRTLTLRLLVSSGEEARSRREAAALMQKQLKTVGICVEIVRVEADAFEEALSEGNYDMALACFYVTDIPDLRAFFSGNGSLNLNGYSSAAMESCLAELMEAADEGELRSAVSAVNERYLKDLPFMCLYFECHSLLFDESISGITSVREDDAFMTVPDWSIEP